jgi:type IV pilus assembly protein PilE
MNRARIFSARRADLGFTLIELMITVAIIAILASIAIPSYQQYVTRSNEAVAKSFLSEVASRQQAFYNDRRRYAASLADLGYPAANTQLGRDGQPAAAAVNPIYQVAVRASSANNRTYVLDAVPQGVQATRSKCGTLSLTAQDVRSASGPSGDTCWSR